MQRSILFFSPLFSPSKDSLGRWWMRKTRLIDNVEEMLIILNEMKKNATEMLARDYGIQLRGRTMFDTFGADGHHGRRRGGGNGLESRWRHEIEKVLGCSLFGEHGPVFERETFQTTLPANIQKSFQRGRGIFGVGIAVGAVGQRNRRLRKLTLFERLGHLDWSHRSRRDRGSQTY